MAQPTIVVVGAGPAGIRAAERLVAAGLRPIVVDEAPRAGGQIYRRPPSGLERPDEKLYGSEAGRARAIHAAFEAIKDRIDYRPSTLCASLAADTLRLVSDGRQLREVRYDRLILATGARDRLLAVRGWTLPGVFSLGGAQIALKAAAATIGRRPVLMGTGPLLTLVAVQYLDAGVAPAAVVEVGQLRQRLAALPWLVARPRLLALGARHLARLRLAGIRLIDGATPLAITGSARVEAVSVIDRRQRRIDLACDAVGLGFGLAPETQLADLAGAAFAFDAPTRQWLPVADAMGRAGVGNVYLAGDGARILGADAAEMSGRLAALAVLTDLGHEAPAGEAASLERGLRRMRRFADGLERSFAWPHELAAGCEDDVPVCRCETVPASELRHAARRLDAREVNRAKAFARVGMGRCQGRYCGHAAAEVLARELALPIAAVGRLRGQAPVKPVAIATERVP